MIKCTYGDLDRLRDTPTRPGALGKLANATELSIVDRFRIGKLVKAADAELATYQKSVLELARKCGEEVRPGNWSMKPEFAGEFAREKAKLDSDTCELPVNKLPVTAYEKVELSALDLITLEPFIELPAEY